MVQCITKQIETIVKTLGEEGTLRVCSVGCGDGKLDKKIMRELATAHSALTIKYVGVGLCEHGNRGVKRWRGSLDGGSW